MSLETTRRQLLQMVASLPVAASLATAEPEPEVETLSLREGPPCPPQPMVCVALDGGPHFSKVQSVTSVQAIGNGRNLMQVEVSAVLTQGNSLILDRLWSMIASNKAAQWEVLGVRFCGRIRRVDTSEMAFMFAVDLLESVKQ